MEKIKLTRVNDGKQFEVDPGTTIGAIAPPIVKDPKTGKEFPVLVAFVDHKLEALSYPVYYPHEVEFIGYNHADGRRAVFRSLSFLAQRAARTTSFKVAVTSWRALATPDSLDSCPSPTGR